MHSSVALVLPLLFSRVAASGSQSWARGPDAAWRFFSFLRGKRAHEWRGGGRGGVSVTKRVEGPAGWGGVVLNVPHKVSVRRRAV